MKKSILAMCLLLSVGCTNEYHSRMILQANGFTYISFTGYRWFMCGEGDWYHTGFVAQSPSGTAVGGAVCEGLLFKGSTIRFE